MKKLIYKLTMASAIILSAKNSIGQVNPTIIWPEYFEPKNCPVYVHNEIEINAKPEDVWAWLIDINKWEDWYEIADNVKITSSDTTILKSDTQFNWETFGLKLNSEVKEFVPNSRLAFTVKSKGLDTYHAWLIIPTAFGCKVITDETQHGWLAKLGKVFKPNQVFNGHEIWLKQLKFMSETKPIHYLSCRNPLLYKPSTVNNKEREIIISVLNESLAKFNDATSNLTTEQLNFKPSNSDWSIFQCIEHVCLAELRFPVIVKEQIIKPAQPAERADIKLSDFAIRKKLTDRNWKARSPEIFKPSNKYKSASEAIIDFKEHRAKTMDYIKTTNDDLFNHFWKHPATGVVDLYQTIILMSAHLERHLVQLENVKLHKDYPKNNP